MSNGKIKRKYNKADELITRIFTDGSCLSNQNKDDRKCGSATLITVAKPEDYINIVCIGRYLKDNTNNYGELWAVHESFKWLLKGIELKEPLPYNTVFYIDSRQVIGIVSGKTKYSKNVELINKILSEKDKLIKAGYSFKFLHVKAHTNKSDILSKCNDTVDKVAKDCAKNEKDYYKKWN